MENLKENVLEALAELGFVVDNPNEDFCMFQCGMTNIAYEVTEDDTMLKLSVPFVANTSDGLRIEHLIAAANDVNYHIKYAKAWVGEDCCHLFYEQHLQEWDEEHLEEILSFAIDHLVNSKMYIHSRIAEMLEGNSETEEE